VHQIRFPNSIPAPLPTPQKNPSWFKGALLLREEKEREGEGKGKKEVGKGRKGRE